MKFPYSIPSFCHGHPRTFLRITGSTVVHLTWSARRDPHSGALSEIMGTWNAQMQSGRGEGDDGVETSNLLWAPLHVLVEYGKNTRAWLCASWVISQGCGCREQT